MVWVKKKHTKKNKQKKTPKTKKRNQHRKRVKKSVYGSALKQRMSYQEMRPQWGILNAFQGEQSVGETPVMDIWAMCNGQCCTEKPKAQYIDTSNIFTIQPCYISKDANYIQPSIPYLYCKRSEKSSAK